MKALLPLLAAIALLALSFSSCLGPKVDSVALFEPAALTWPAVEEDVLRGIDNAEEAGNNSDWFIEEGRAFCSEVGLSIVSKDRNRLRKVDWNSLRGWGALGIESELESGNIGPGVASSLREQLSNFSTIILKLQEP